MATVEVDTIPVNKTLPLPTGSYSHGIVIKNHPSSSFGNPALPRIEALSDPLVGEVSRIISNFVGGNQLMAIVVLFPGNDIGRLRPFRIPFRQASQISFRHREILRGVVPFEIGFANIVNHIVLLLWNHPSLRDH